MDANTLYQTLRNGTPEARRALLAQLPDTGFGAQAESLVALGKPGMVVIGLVPVIVKLCMGVDPEVGRVLALATHRYAVEMFETQADHGGLLPMTLSNLAQQYANACNLLGDSEATLAFTDQWIPYYTKLGERENLPGLKTARINALLNLRQLEAAQQALADPTLRGNWANDIEVARLEKLLADLLQSPTADRESAQQRRAKQERVGIATPEVKTALTKALEMGIDDPDQRAQLQKLLGDRLAQSQPTDLTDPTRFAEQLNALRGVEEFFTRGSGADSELTIRRRVREASGIFVGRQPPPEEIRASLADLEQCLAWAKDKRHTELARDAWWGIYICHSRLNEPSAAADAVLALRADIEAERAGIEDPMKRAGVFSRYPYLFPALCEKLQLAGRTEELLEAIEASKGRGVADILTDKAGRPVSDASVYSAARRLPQLTRRLSFHYMTFYVDEERTYVVLVSKQGEVRALQPVPLGHAAIRAAAGNADPRTGDTAHMLAPLVAWIAELIAAGVIARGDHIVSAPDEDLSNVPLQYLIVGGKPLLDLVSLSRIHGAAHLEHVLEGSGAAPQQSLSFVVPLKQNTTSKVWPELQGYLQAPVDELRARRAGDVLEMNAATLARLREQDLRGRILHFSAHGMFPEPDSQDTPFENSGIVLATTRGLPDKDRFADGDLEGLLTPSDVLDFKLDLTGSHVSIMTCVSGLSREGIGGDALGIDWAFTQAGAASLLTSHWNVSAKVVGPFFQRFYELWLGKPMSRAHALAQVVAEFRQQGEPFGAPEAWAAFSLTGDWR